MNDITFNLGQIHDNFNISVATQMMTSVQIVKPYSPFQDYPPRKITLYNWQVLSGLNPIL